MKILLELRAAFDGYSGIPQETRLLFRGLKHLANTQVIGLIQSNNLAVAQGLPLRRGELAATHGAAAHVERSSRVVVSLQQGAVSSRFEYLRNNMYRFGGPLVAGASSLVGLSVPLSGFDPTHFRDFVWRSMFSKTLPLEDFDAVTASEYSIFRWPWSFVNFVGVATAALGHAVYPRLDTSGIDVMIAETPYPGRVRGSTRLVVRYHDAIPLLMPHTIKNRGYHRAMHLHALKRNAADGAWFACVSDATRDDLLSVLPELEPRAVTIPNMISHHFMSETEPAARVQEIVWSRKNRTAPHQGGAGIAREDLVDGTFPYLLMVSTVEPRKNHLALLDAWEMLRAGAFPRLNLVCVGGLGWEHDAILRRFSPWFERGGVHLLEDVPAADLRLLYRHAQATVCPSFGEGFDFSGVEAMRSGGLVAASDIRVHREIYATAAEYFSPYSAPEMAACIAGLLGPGAATRREALRHEAEVVSQRYLPERVMPLWQEFLRQVVA